MNRSPLARSLRTLRPQFLVLILGWLALSPLSPLIPRALTLVIDADIDRGAQMELFVNDESVLLHSIPIVAGKRSTYKLDQLSSSSAPLRWDPADENGAVVHLYRVVVLRGNHVVREFTPEEIQKWRVANATLMSADAGQTSILTATSNDPMVWIPVHAELSPVYEGLYWASALALGCIALLLYGALRVRVSSRSGKNR